jgi:hypothetical protein
MAVPYRILLRELSIRVNAVLATTTAQMETAYTTTPLTSTQIGSPIFPYTAVVDTLFMGIGKYVNAIANSEHPNRSYLRGLTSAVANKTALPTVTSGSIPVVGIPGNVYDSSDSTPCDRMPLREVLLRAANPGSFFKNETYWWALDGATICHTRTNVIIEVCQYSESAQRVSLAANGDWFLPDDLQASVVDESLRQAFRDDEFVLQAEKFGQLSDQTLAKFPPVLAIAA